MCSIAGALDVRTDPQVLEKMLETMRRRGPDGRGTYREGNCCLLHSRLAVIDPAGGRQPMALSWQSEEYIMIYNGELYNTQEIRSQLEYHGHRFNTHSDTEVVLRAFAQYGEACLDHLNGIFAFAVWMPEKQRLFLARDRIGVKPLFYTQSAGGLIFASEMKTILAHPAVKPQLDVQGAVQLIMLGPGRLPGSGVFRGIRELEPGCCGWYENQRLYLKRYWRLTDREHMDSFTQTVEKTRFLVTDSIRRQMVSDVGIGTFLSGGLDSSIISAVCAREFEKSGESLCTFSVDYENNDRNFVAGKFQPEADSAYIRRMRDYLNSDHYETILNSSQLWNQMQAATIARDLPGMADVDFSLLSFCEQIRKKTKVALSGECADEIFGGYPWYRDPQVRATEGFPWAQNSALRVSLLHPAVADGIDPYSFVMDCYMDTCKDSDILPGTDPEDRRIKEMVNLNFRWFMQTLLDRKDRMSMYHSLEVRVPFCDYRIAEYLYAVPWKFKDYGGREKGLLREAVKDLLPQEVLYRKKSPYPKTFDPEYAMLIRENIKVLLSDDKAPVFSLIRRDSLEKMLSSENPWPWYGQLMRGPQTMAYILQLDFWLQHYQVELLF